MSQSRIEYRKGMALDGDKVYYGKGSCFGFFGDYINEEGEYYESEFLFIPMAPEDWDTLDRIADAVKAGTTKGTIDGFSYERGEGKEIYICR